MDYASRYAEKSERMIELRLRKLYREAQKDLEAKFRKFTETKARRDREMRKKLEDGKISDQEYKDWLKGQAFIGERWKAKINQATESLLHANEEAMAIVRGEQFNVFAESANFEAYSIEKHYGGAVSFDIYDTDTVQMLVRDKPSLLPPRKVNGKKDRAWNQGIISNCVAQGIIQGESMDKIAQRIAHDTANSDMKAMMRYARTAVTAARNMGSLETMDRASKMGIKLQKQWIATLDSRTRDTHRHLDGETVDYDKPFKSDLGDIRCPGDPEATPANVYNCRCDMVTVYPEYAEFEEDWRKDEVIDGQTYEEWKWGKGIKAGRNIDLKEIERENERLAIADLAEKYGIAGDPNEKKTIAKIANALIDNTGIPFEKSLWNGEVIIDNTITNDGNYDIDEHFIVVHDNTDFTTIIHELLHSRSPKLTMGQYFNNQSMEEVCVEIISRGIGSTLAIRHSEAYGNIVRSFNKISKFVGEDGYDMALELFRYPVQDRYAVLEKKVNEAFKEKKIDGWEKSTYKHLLVMFKGVNIFGK